MNIDTYCRDGIFVYRDVDSGKMYGAFDDEGEWIYLEDFNVPEEVLEYFKGENNVLDKRF